MENKPLAPKQEELGIDIPAGGKPPIESTQRNNYQQNNYFLHLPPDVTLPPAEEFNKYSSDVRAFLLDGARLEQQARHTWIAREQELRGDDWKGQRINKLVGMFFGTLLAIVFGGCGTILIWHGQSFGGYASMIVALAWLIRAAVHGFAPKPSPAPEDDSEGSGKENANGSG